MTSQSITKHRSREKVTHLTVTALFAALICITTAFIFHIPFGINGGYIHLGDTLIYLSAALLPMPYAMAAGAIGGALADLLTAPLWMPATFIIKAILPIMFTNKKATIINIQNIVAIFVAGLICIVGYCIAEVILYGSKAALFASVTSSLIQAIGSGVLFIVIGLAFDRMNLKKLF